MASKVSIMVGRTERWSILLAFVSIILGITFSAGQSREQVPDSSSLTRKYIIQTLGFQMIKALKLKYSELPLVQQAPLVNKVFFLGDHDMRSEGAAMTYFNLISHVAGTRFEFLSSQAPGEFAIVMDPTIADWEALLKVLDKGNSAENLLYAVSESIESRAEFHTCEYISIYKQNKIVGGLAFINTKHGFVSSDVCLYKAIFNLFGLNAPVNPDTGARNVVLDLLIVRELYHLSESDRAIDRVTDVLAEKPSIQNFLMRPQ